MNWFLKELVKDGTLEVVGPEVDPYMWKIRLGFGFQVHVFFRMDKDAPHDHPYDFWTFPFVDYIEEYLHTVPEGRNEYYRHVRYDAGERYLRHREVSAWRRHDRKAEMVHRILYPAYTKIDGWGVEYSMSEGYKKAGALSARWPIVTLIRHGKRRRDWGFWTGGQRLPDDIDTGAWPVSFKRKFAPFKWVWWRTYLYGETYDPKR